MTADSIDDYADVLDARRRAVWGTVAAAAHRCGGVLMGGTALAIHLRHRVSMDFDVFTVDDFYHPAVVDVLRSGGHTYDAYMVRHNSVNVSLDGVMVQILRDSPDPQAPFTPVRQIAPPSEVCGMPVASIQDAFASKLNAVRHRRAPRDLLDIHTVDASTGCKIEDGLRLHRIRYGIDAQDQILDGIAALLDGHTAGTLEVEGTALDSDSMAEAVERVAARLPEVIEVAAAARAGATASELEQDAMTSEGIDQNV